MENLNPFILHRKREFGEFINDGFKVIKMNFRAILTAFMIYVLPIVAIGSFLMGSTGDAVVRAMSGDIGTIDDIPGMVKGFGMFYAVILLGALFTLLICYATMIAFEENEGQSVDFQAVKSHIGRMFAPVLISFIIMFFIIVIPVALVAGIAVGLHPATLILTGPLLFVGLMYISIPLQFYPYIMVRESLSHGDAIKRSFYLVKSNWWATFGVYFVASIIASLLSYIFVLPGQLIAGVLSFSSVDPAGGVTNSFLWMSLGFLLMTVGSLLFNIYMWVCLLIKYYDLLERKDNKGLKSRIEQLGTNEESMFDNEGEF